MNSTPQPSTLGFIGLGVMGLPMALNLFKAGYPLLAWNRTPGRASELIDAGAVIVEHPKTLALRCDTVFINVSDDAAVESVLFGPSGLIEEANEPRRVRTVIDMGTTSPKATKDFARRCADLGIDFLDAPVSGGTVGAKAGALSIMVGGDATAFESARPLFDALGRNIVHIGEHGAGQIAKACNQIVVSATLLGVAEAITFARANGVDPAKVREALLGGFAYSRILEVHGQRMLDNHFEPGFRTRLHCKDLGIVMDAATQAGLHLAATEIALDHLNVRLKAGDGELDSAVLIRSVKG